ncbi:hypothetical protein CAS74_001405 [Pichia kudriavzevii]|uniref:Vacuolar protein sorting-associated protein VTA1 n=1 Tax=Pichia kudriavzevii TaxID=4909 RepID=A0A1Z8JR70_PICKU|nr:hypothetical protein CAS74_001405 [Pichia kudriavzevii]
MGDIPTLENVPAEAEKTIGPFIKRGREVATAQPLISYYCYLYAAQLILESKLHTQYTSVAEYIEVLLDTIETNRKSLEEGAPKLAEILLDKEKSFKLVLGFTLSIFNKSYVFKKTVQGFMAFLNFIEILKLWPEIYETKKDELQKQIKYAKYHSNRVLKSLKNGEDPNDYVTENDKEMLDQLLQEQFEGTQDGVQESPTDEIAPTLPEPPSNAPNNDIVLPTAPVLIKNHKNSLGLPAGLAYPQLPPKPPKASSDDESPDISKISIKRTPGKSQLAKDGKVMSREEKAKYAISALNYEDIETAIKELQEALKLLKGE